jgi:hypothetical protein
VWVLDERDKNKVFGEELQGQESRKSWAGEGFEEESWGMVASACFNASTLEKGAVHGAMMGKGPGGKLHSTQNPWVIA